MKKITVEIPLISHEELIAEVESNKLGSRFCGFGIVQDSTGKRYVLYGDLDYNERVVAVEDEE